MQALAELLRDAAALGVISESDLYTTEAEVIDRLLGDPRTAARWRAFRAYSRIDIAERPGDDGAWRRIRAKKRFIDPMVLGRGRISALFPAFARGLAAFLGESQELWLRAMP